MTESDEIVKACEVCSGVGWLPSTDPYLDHARPRCEACGGSGRPDEIGQPRPRYSPFCRQAAHPTVVHHEMTERHYSCDCPCHVGNEASPWWTDWAAERVTLAGERRAMRLAAKRLSGPELDALRPEVS